MAFDGGGGGGATAGWDDSRNSWRSSAGSPCVSRYSGVPSVSVASSIFWCLPSPAGDVTGVTEGDRTCSLERRWWACRFLLGVAAC